MELIGPLLLTVNLLSPIIFVYFYQKLQKRISNLEFDNDDFRRRIFDLESNIMKLVSHIGEIFSKLDKSTQEQKQTEQKNFNYETTKLSNPEITKDLVNEIVESNKSSKDSRKTLFDDIWKIEPPVKK